MDANLKKVIVCNRTALGKLYNSTDLSKVTVAIQRLVEADAVKSITTTVVWLDDAVQMAVLKAPVVKVATDSAQNKDAIDAVFAAIGADYLTILGAADVVAQQILDNPAADPNDPSVDEDPFVASDLPYASAAPYSRRAADFVVVSRPVGRIPNVEGSKDPTALIAAIDAAATITARPRTDFDAYFSVSVADWQNSTSQSLTTIFGNATSLHLSPPDGPDWTPEQLAPRAHFVNCHGSDHDANWYGQQGDATPLAEQATQIDGKLTKGLIAAAECCYGAQLYPPGVQPPALCNTYMAAGAAAFCGSTTIAYGPATGQGRADLITRDIMINLRAGYPGGTALLLARQAYIASHPLLDGIDLKTLAQFYLLGDSTCTPVASAKDQGQAPQEVRNQSVGLAAWAQDALQIAEPDGKHRRTPEIDSSLLSLAAAHAIEPAAIVSCPVRGGQERSPSLPKVIHLISEAVTTSADGTVASGRVLVVYESEEVTSLKEILYRKG